MNLEKLKNAVDSEFAAVRRLTRLEPQGEKIFPPTYEGGQYATEDRQVRDPDGRLLKVPTVLLDSVQSQANRMELALLRALDARKIRIPLLAVDFAMDNDDPVLREVGRLTALETPHRMCDAIFRDSVTMDGVPFRQSLLGSELNSAKSTNATPVFKMCPSALLFGFWDSTGPRGGLGAKVQRALVSEIVGYECEPGKRPASRIDPVQIQNNVDIFKRAGGGWTSDEALAVRNNDGPVKLKPSEINHGNITPSLTHENKNTRKQELNHGGVTLAYAVQHTVLSLAALRRLRFPVNGTANQEVADLAARTVLAALGLAAICFLDQDGYDLRSRCLLDGAPGQLEFVGGGKTEKFQLDADGATTLLDEAATEARGLGLPWPESPIILKPSGDLRRLVSESRARAMATDSGE